MASSNLRQLAGRICGSLLAGEPFELLARITLLIFLVGPNLIGLEWQYKIAFQVIAIIGLTAPALGCSRLFWVLVAGLMIVKTLDHWWMQDNHVFLLTWWCLTMALAKFSADPNRITATNARLLIGLSFFFAVVWKGFLSPDYLRGDYFHYTFLTDERFSKLGTLFCQMDTAQFATNYKAVGQLTDYTKNVTSISLQGTTSLRTLAIVVTWWTVLIEGALAVIFLLPPHWRFSKSRDAVLLLFAWTTYLAAPVKTFGWTLMTLGLAQCPIEARRTRLCYILTFPLLLVYEIVPLWQTLESVVMAWKK